MERVPFTITCRSDQLPCTIYQLRDRTSDIVMSVPFGLNLTTLTAAECRLRVARYSTLDGRNAGTSAASVDATSTNEGAMIFGWTIHNFRG